MFWLVLAFTIKQILDLSAINNLGSTSRLSPSFWLRLTFGTQFFFFSFTIHRAVITLFQLSAVSIRHAGTLWVCKTGKKMLNRAKTAKSFDQWVILMLLCNTSLCIGSTWWRDIIHLHHHRWKKQEISWGMKMQMPQKIYWCLSLWGLGHI